MINVVVAFAKSNEAAAIRGLLARNGFGTPMVCTSGAQVLSQTDGLNDGLIICGYKLTDMLYSQLQECLPEGFQMLLLASPAYQSECLENGVECLTMPLKGQELLDKAALMAEEISRRRRRRRLQPRVRNPEEEALLTKAKGLLMEGQHMTEAEAHRYLQECSMDSGTNLVETAQMLLAMEKN